MKTLDYILKKFNITVGRQYQIDVPQMHGSVDLIKLFAELGFKLGVEVGVDRGLFSDYMMKNIPDVKMFGVDPWLNDVYEKDNPYKLSQRYFDECYEEAVRRLEPFGDRYTIIKRFSMDALKEFEDNSLDFVYIDSNHDFLNLSMDVHYWLRKVKHGGIISGHDYAYFPAHKFNHVKRALDAYMASYRLFPYFAVMYVGDGLKRDKYRSWFYVKP